MTHEELLARITIDPAVCHGNPCIRGHRIWVGLVLGMLEGGMREEEIETLIVVCAAEGRQRRGSLGHGRLLVRVPLLDM